MTNDKQILKKLISHILILIYSLTLWAYMSQATFTLYQSAPYILIIILYVIYLIFFGKLNKSVCWLGGILLFYDGISLIINQGGTGSWTNQLYIITIVITFGCVELDSFSLNYLLLSNLILWLSWFFRSKNYYDAFLINSNILNSNSVAEVLMFSFEMIVVLRKMFFRKNAMIDLFFCVLTFLGLLSCESRTAEIAFFVFLICNFLIAKSFWNKKLVLLFSFFIMLGGTLFPQIYLSLENNTNLAQFVYTLSGKDLFTGRQLIWNEVFNYGFGNSLPNWAFGLGSHTELGVNTAWGNNMHNSYLGIILDFGIIGLIFFILFILRNISIAFDNKCINDVNLILIFAFWSFLIIGWSETVLIWEMSLPIAFSIIGFAQNNDLKKWDHSNE